MPPSPERKRLRRDDFAFFGFEALTAPLDETLSQIGIRGGEPAIATVDNALFIPTREIAPHQFEGALLAGDGQPIPQARAERRKSRWGSRVLGDLSQPVPLGPEQVIDDEVVYLGWYFDHFGHFLLESLARAWALPSIDPAAKVLVHAQRRPAFSGAARRILSLLGIPPERILFLDQQTRLRRVIVPEPLYEISHVAHERMPDPYRRIAVALAPADPPSEQPVYLSRRLLSSRQRSIVGELAMEDVCRENGFLVVHPETMAFDEQVRLVNRHRQLFTSAGSAAYLPLFALRPPALHLLTAGVPFADYFLVPAAAGFEAAYANVLTGGERLSAHYAPLLVQIDQVSAYLDHLGLLKRRLRGALAARVLDLQPAYDEAWLYRAIATDARNQPLPAELDAEATRLAATSWPISWALARHSLGPHPTRVDHLARQFTTLAAAETDLTRLAHFHEDIARGLNPVLSLCTPETAARLTTLVRDRFQIDPATEEHRQAERRRARHPSGR